MSANLFAANFVGTDKDIVQEAERQFNRSAIFWTGKEINLNYACPIQFVEKNIEGGGGATVYGTSNGKLARYKIEVFGNKKYVLDNVVPHETDHLVRGALTLNQIDNWIGEGCAQLFETPEFKDEIRTRVKYYITSPNDQFSCWNHLGAYQYPANVDMRNFYDTSFTVAEYLLLRSGKESLLAFQADTSPHSESKWQKHFGETSKESFQRWNYQYAQPKTIIYVASDPAVCVPCRKFEADKAQGRFSGLEFEYVKAESIGQGNVEYIDSTGKKLTKEEGFGRIPAFRVSGTNVVRVGYGENTGLWGWVKDIAKGPSAALQTAEDLTKAAIKTATPKQPVSQPAQPIVTQPITSDPAPVPIETSTPLAYQKAREKALETKVDALADSLSKLLEAIKDAKDKDPEKMAEAVREAIKTVKDSADVVRETKDLKEENEKTPEKETPWWMILGAAILGAIKRKFGNREAS